MKDMLDALRVTRRRFGVIAGGAIVSFAVEGPYQGNELAQTDGGRITARPRRGVRTSGSGTTSLRLHARRDAILRLPGTASSGPLPLLVLLHGAGGSGDGILRRFSAVTDGAGVAVLAPDSRGATWDAVGGRLGPDIEFLDRALDRAFERVDVDPLRIAVGGFSDGASYALSIGLTNGDLFRHIVAFSPGFVTNGAPQGKPRIFVSHGTGDRILPIDRCSRIIVPALKRHGYDVVYREFEGGHTVPTDIARDGMAWVAGRTPH